MARARKTAPKLEEVQEAEAKQLGKSDKLNEVVRRGIRTHKNPPAKDLMAHSKRISANIKEARALKELREKPSDDDFNE